MVFKGGLHINQKILNIGVIAANGVFPCRLKSETEGSGSSSSTRKSFLALGATWRAHSVQKVDPSASLRPYLARLEGWLIQTYLWGFLDGVRRRFREAKLSFLGVLSRASFLWVIGIVMGFGWVGSLFLTYFFRN